MINNSFPEDQTQGETGKVIPGTQNSGIKCGEEGI